MNSFQPEGGVLLRSRRGKPRKGLGGYAVFCAFVALLTAQNYATSLAQSPEPQAIKLLQAGQGLAEKTHYLEALDLLQEARDVVEASGAQQTPLYADVLYTLAQTKIRGRLHQEFPAHYVKTALDDVQLANKLREQLSGILPQKLAQGYFLEGYIHKKFFLRRNEALACLRRAVSMDPGSAAAKRELFELEATKESKEY